ncbi:MAG: YdcF family protein [Desulfovibrionaceae bacterium]
MRWLAARFFQVVGALALAGGLAFAVLMFFAGDWLQAPDALERADAIVSLAGAFTRAPYAASLYKRGLAPKVWVSRPNRNRHFEFLRSLGYDVPVQEEVNQRLLAQGGVPDDAVVSYGKGVLSTAEEAEALRDAMADALGAGPRRIIVVTSPYHVYRARLIFRRVLPDWTVMVVGTPDEPFPTDWWRRRSAALAVVSETAKTAFFLAGGVFRAGQE